jgi:hypothetical protein
MDLCVSLYEDMHTVIFISYFKQPNIYFCLILYLLDKQTGNTNNIFSAKLFGIY